MAKYGTYDPTKPYDVMADVTRRRAELGIRDNSVAGQGKEQWQDRNAEQARTGDYRNRPGDISLSSAAQHPSAPKAPQAVAPPQTEHTPSVEESVRHASAPPKIFDDARAIMARGAHESPEWGTDFSLASVAQDETAREGISDRYRAGVERANAEEALRGDPMSLAINARRKNLAYEDLMPASADSHVTGHFGSKGWGGLNGSEIGGDYSGTQPGEPTMGEYRANRSLIAQAQAKQNPKDVAEGALGMGRGRIAEELDLYRRGLDESVARAVGTPGEAQAKAQAAAKWQTALSQAQALAELLKNGYPTQPNYSGDIGTQQPTTK